MEARNAKLLAQDTLSGFGAMGEGISMQVTANGRRILWMAHESAPKNFSAIDVTEPSRPRLITQTSLPHARMRSNSLEVVGQTMVVAYQVNQLGLEPAGFEIFDISVPENPRSIGFYSVACPHGRGVHQLWFVDGETVHMSASDPDLMPRDARDDQIYQVVSIRNPARPHLLGRWWMPGTMVNDSADSPQRVPAPYGTAIRAHNTNVWPARADRAYLGYLDGGAVILDISDPTHMRLVSQWRNAPPMKGFTHTYLPLFSRGLAVVADESIKPAAQDWPKLLWVVDISDEGHPLPIATCQVTEPERYFDRGGRFGAHNLHENYPHAYSFQSDRFVVGTFFNGGLRAFDLKDAYRPEEVAVFVPETPQDSPVSAVQVNDVFVDERAIAYVAERYTGGLYVVELSL